MAEGIDLDEDVEVHVIEVSQDGSLTFSIEYQDKFFTANMPSEAYGLFVEALEKSSIADEQPLHVDQTWGIRALDIVEEEGTL